MNGKSIIAFFCALLVSVSGFYAYADGTNSKMSNSYSRDLRQALELQSRGMHNRASVVLKNISDEVRTSDPEGYAILSDVTMNMKAYAAGMNL